MASLAVQDFASQFERCEGSGRLGYSERKCSVSLFLREAVISFEGRTTHGHFLFPGHALREEFVAGGDGVECLPCSNSSPDTFDEPVHTKAHFRPECMKKPRGHKLNVQVPQRIPAVLLPPFTAATGSRVSTTSTCIATTIIGVASGLRWPDPSWQTHVCVPRRYPDET